SRFPAVAAGRDPSESKLVHTLSGVFRDCPGQAKPTLCDVTGVRFQALGGRRLQNGVTFSSTDQWEANLGFT
ncbi:hypothetical protein CRENBAI_002018, partial [Crenichthys baileyi]